MKKLFSVMLTVLLLTGCSSTEKLPNPTMSQNSVSGSIQVHTGTSDSASGSERTSDNPDPFANFHTKESGTEEKVDRDKLNAKQKPVAPVSLHPAICMEILQSKQEAGTGMVRAEVNYRECMLRAAIDSKNLHYCMDAGLSDVVSLDQCVNTLIVQASKQNIAKHGPAYPKNFCKEISKQILTPETLGGAESEQLIKEVSSLDTINERCYVAYAALSDNADMCSKNSSGISELEYKVPGAYASDYDASFLDDCRWEVIGNGKKHDRNICDGITTGGNASKQKCMSYLNGKHSDNGYRNLISPFERIPSSDSFFNELKEVQKELDAFKKKMNGYDELLK